MARRRTGKKIDFVHWTGFSVHADALAAGSIASTAIAAAHEPETILRMRGEFAAYLDGTGAPGVKVQVAAGLILVPEGTGTTVLWSPFTDADAPWLWYDIGILAHEELVVDVIDIPGMSSYRRVVDNKAMRITRNQEVQFVVENSSLLTAKNVNVSLVGRTLTGK